jgi:hypothetical protein
MTGPILLGIDFRKVPAASAAILLNDEIIAVSQDTLVEQGRRVKKVMPPAPPPTGNWIQYDRIWNDTCANVGEPAGVATVSACEAHCLHQSPSCTAINWNSAGKLCYLRACPPSKLVPHWADPGWTGYAFNGTIPGRVNPGAQVWYKVLANGDRAVAAYNSGTAPQDIELDFEDVGFAPTTALRARDLYARTEFDAEGKWLAKAVPGHGVRMLRVSLAASGALR